MELELHAILLWCILKMTNIIHHIIRDILHGNSIAVREMPQIYVKCALCDKCLQFGMMFGMGKRLALYSHAIPHFICFLV